MQCPEASQLPMYVDGEVNSKLENKSFVERKTVKDENCKKYPKITFVFLKQRQLQLLTGAV